MKVQAKAGYAFASLDDSDAGEGLAIFFSQSATDTQRWRLEVYATLDNGMNMLVGFFYVSPPNAINPPTGPLSRQVAAAVCPGAKSWEVIASAVGGSAAANNEMASIHLASSKCCTAPVGVTRVGERYGFESGVAAAPTNFNVLPGRTITRITVSGIAPGGQVNLGYGTLATVPTGVVLTLDPKAPIVSAQISFNLVNYAVEYLESA